MFRQRPLPCCRRNIIHASGNASRSAVGILPGRRAPFPRVTFGLSCHPFRRCVAVERRKNREKKKKSSATSRNKPQRAVNAVTQSHPGLTNNKSTVEPV